MKLLKNRPINLINPWLDPANDNWLMKEFEIVKDRVNLSYYQPEKAVEWVCRNKQENRLLDALTHLAPMQPLLSYHGLPSIWLSPPMSGSGNEVVVVLGKNKGQLRMVGCNFCNVKLALSNTKTHPDFWVDYDACRGDLDKYRLISEFVSENFDSVSLARAKYVDDQCFDYRTMPLHIVCIDQDAVHIWSMPCLIWPVARPSNMKLEMVKEF
jgi:hypothetical protein